MNVDPPTLPDKELCDFSQRVARLARVHGTNMVSLILAQCCVAVGERHDLSRDEIIQLCADVGAMLIRGNRYRAH